MAKESVLPSKFGLGEAMAVSLIAERTIKAAGKLHFSLVWWRHEYDHPPQIRHCQYKNTKVS
jgi:hypothetical protein